ncbi:cholesterol esterase [Coemansia sp. Benny D115]|nr:cholesterol esterase [Coemansia sp. Benny D115]
MLYIPFFSRLSLSEYQGMLIAALFFIVEKFLRVFLVLFPVGVIVEVLPEWVLVRLKIPQLAVAHKEAERELLDDFNSFAQIMDYWSYPYEDHLVETRDGFILGTHRITGPRIRPPSSSSSSSSSSSTSTDCMRGRSGGRPLVNGTNAKPVVLLWHGFMLNSECFVCHPDWINILPFRLAEAGYDVWLGNSRGNKYSYKHVKYEPNDRRFWNFSIDEIANVDVPATIDYVLKETGAASLTYIGFSQGTAQMFMALSRNKQLNEKVSHFIALAPATTPRGFHNSIVDYFTKATPHMLYLLFGRRRAMSLVYFWINLLPRDLYVTALDFCVHLLFGWRMRNLSQETKCITYWHLYSYTSVKAIVHWMQIIRCGQLQMYDEDPPVYPLFWSTMPTANPSVSCNAQQDDYVTKSERRRLPKKRLAAGALTHWNNTYPLRNITTRVSLFYGGSDSLSSVDHLLEELYVASGDSTCFDHYEHMDFLWADSVGTLVLPKVLAAMGIQESSTIPRREEQQQPNGTLSAESSGTGRSGNSLALRSTELELAGAGDLEGGISDCEDLPLPPSAKHRTAAVSRPLTTSSSSSSSTSSRTVNTLSRRRIVSMPAGLPGKARRGIGSGGMTDWEHVTATSNLLN